MEAHRAPVCTLILSGPVLDTKHLLTPGFTQQCTTALPSALFSCSFRLRAFGLLTVHRALRADQTHATICRPFAHKIHRNVALILVILLLITIPYNLLAFPFSTQSPFKAFFRQTVDLDSNSTGLVHLYGLSDYLASEILTELPSSRDAGDINCKERSSLTECTFPGPAPLVARGQPVDWIRINATRVSQDTAHIVVSGRETRNCRLYFDQPVSSLQVAGHKPLTSLQDITQLRMWTKQDWNPDFTVTAKWTGGGKLKGRAACLWAELIPGRIPALDEALTFKPAWVELVPEDQGLVEVSKAFEV